MIKVSVIIPVFNVEKYVEECVRSVMQQTLKEIEILCIDDGSTDQSSQILATLADEDNRIKVITKENTGYGNTVNTGIDKANGKYIGIVESDDYIEPDMYEKLYAVAEQEELDLVKAGHKDFIEKDGIKEFTHKEILGLNSALYGCVIENDSIRVKFSGQMYTWAGIYRREFLNANNIRHNETPGASYQDNGFWFQTMMYAKRMMFYKGCFYNYRRDNLNASVLNKGKAFCMCDEYDFIHQKIENSDLPYKKQLFEICFSQRVYNYIWTQNRIGVEFYDIFFERIKRDLQVGLALGEANPELMGLKRWNYIYQIIMCNELPELCETYLSDSLVKKINSSNEIYLYGAGMIGERNYNMLCELGYKDKIRAFIVSENDGTSIKFGLPVVSLNDVKYDMSSLIIISVGKKYKTIIEQKLKEIGISNYVKDF